MQEVGEERRHRRGGDVPAHHHVPLPLLPLEATAELAARRQDVHDLGDKVCEQSLHGIQLGDIWQREEH